MESPRHGNKTPQLTKIGTATFFSQLPYSVRKIFVQEDILGAFLEIFKERLKKLILSVSNEKIADITYPSGRNILLLKQAIQKAKQDGIEVYQPGSLSGDYLPTVFIGGAPDTDADAPFAVVLSFRTANEAVSLANNDKQAFGAIVWAENISLVNEVSKKLKVCYCPREKYRMCIMFIVEKLRLKKKTICSKNSFIIPHITFHTCASNCSVMYCVIFRCQTFGLTLKVF